MQINIILAQSTMAVTCPVCLHSFYHKGTLNRHIKRKHAKKEDIVVLQPICPAKPETTMEPEERVEPIEDETLTLIPVSSGKKEPEERIDSIEDEILTLVPVSQRKKMEKLLDGIKRCSHLGWNHRGELVENGDVIPNTQLLDLTQYVLGGRKKKAPHGWKKFAKSLKKARLVHGVVGNCMVKRWLNRH